MSQSKETFDSEEQERKFGRLPGMYRVVDLFDDTKDEVLEVQLAGMDYYPRENAKPLPRNHVHWVILWHLGDKFNVPCYRLLQIITERYFSTDASGRESFKAVYTNWGPHTKSVTDAEMQYAFRVPLARLSLQERRALEEIARAETVEEPNGEWNCQSWVRSVLKKAVDAGLLRENSVTTAFNELSVSFYSIEIHIVTHTLLTLQSEDSLNVWLAQKGQY